MYKTGEKNVSRYSDASVLISQLSKSCSCGIKTDAVPVSDLGGRERGGAKRVGGRVRQGRRENKIKKRRERGKKILLTEAPLSISPALTAERVKSSQWWRNGQRRYH